MKKSFSLIEMLVVIAIIGLLTGVAALSYSTLTKNSRDARRKSDIEQIRSALELYRSDSGAYPTLAAGNCTGVQPTITPYLAKSPTDPNPNASNYYYCGLSSGTTYTVGTYLENGLGSCPVPCGVSTNCNYTEGPYGQTCP